MKFLDLIEDLEQLMRNFEFDHQLFLKFSQQLRNYMVEPYLFLHRNGKQIIKWLQDLLPEK